MGDQLSGIEASVGERVDSGIPGTVGGAEGGCDLEALADHVVDDEGRSLVRDASEDDTSASSGRARRWYGRRWELRADFDHDVEGLVSVVVSSGWRVEVAHTTCGDLGTTSIGLDYDDLGGERSA